MYLRLLKGIYVRLINATYKNIYFKNIYRYIYIYKKCFFMFLFSNRILKGSRVALIDRDAFKNLPNLQKL